MKKCTYCGKEYPDETTACAVDGQPLLAASTGEPSVLASLPGGDSNESIAQADTFRITKGFRVSKAINCAVPILFLLTPIALWLYWNLWSDSQFIRVEFKWWFPLAVVGFIFWTMVEVSKASRASRFKISISDTSITVDGVTKQWAEIQKAEKRHAFAMKPAILLTCADSMRLQIPAVVDGLDFIWTQVQKHVSDSTQPK